MNDDQVLTAQEKQAKSWRKWLEYKRVFPYNLLVWGLLAIYLLPVAFMVVTALMSTEQLLDPRTPLYPAKRVTYEWEGKTYLVYRVPVSDDNERELALVKSGSTASEFIDPQHPEAGLIRWEGRWQSLDAAYKFSPVWSNLTTLVESVPFGGMLRTTLMITLIGEIGVLVSSILVAYGFARFPLPGGNLLFYILIATIVIPEKVTFVPTYFFNIAVLNWKATIYPLVVPLFFGHAVYIFLLRQNFRSIPIDLEEAAMLDGAGSLRRLVSIVLPQSWPVVITVSLLHFFYAWNETRLAAAYLSSDLKLLTVSFVVQAYPSLMPIDNMIQASTLVVLVIPVILLFLAQRYFMQGLVITGAEGK